MKRNILITGTSTGVGFESAKLFAENGFKVYATMRNLDKSGPLQEAIRGGLDIDILPLDITSIDTIRAAVEQIMSKEGKIDILLNNAGAGFAKTTEQASEEEIRWVTEVNYLGVVFCTQAVLPIMRKQRKGHIINVTSVGGLVGQPFNELYCAAKFAVEGFTESLATYMTAPFNIHFSNIEPGGIATEFMSSAIAATAVEGNFATGEYKPIFERYMAGTRQRAMEGREQTYQTGKEVARVILEVANMDSPPLRKRTSGWAEDFCQFKTQADPDGTRLVNRIRDLFL